MNICLRCGYEWEPRKTDGRVRQCPHCHSAKWDSRAVGKPERAVVTVPKLRAALKAARKATEGKEPDRFIQTAECPHGFQTRDFCITMKGCCK